METEKNHNEYDFPHDTGKTVSAHTSLNHNNVQVLWLQGIALSSQELIHLQDSVLL